MKNFMYGIFLKQVKIAEYARYLLLAVSLLGIFTVVTASQAGGTGSVNSSITNTLCNVFTTIKNVIFLLGLTLMILGGAIYAGANLMPSQSKGGFQGYGMAMIIGGVIGVAIAVAAPFVLNLLLQSNPNGAVNGAGGVVTVSTLCPGGIG